MVEQAGIDSRRRGFFWGPNEWIKQWVPLIGLDGVGLLNSYDVWCDRHEKSDTRGFAFPTRLQEATFYGISKKDLVVLTSILEATGWLRIIRKKRILGHGRGGGGVTYTYKNFYEILDRDRTLTLDDVLAVVRLADKDSRVFKRIRHIFKPEFAPIDDKDNPWLTLLPQLRQHPLWQKLAAREREYSAKIRNRFEEADQSPTSRRSSSVTLGSDTPSNRQSLPVTTGSNGSSNQRSLPVTTGKPMVPTVTANDRKHDDVDDDDGVGDEDVIRYFASLVGHATYEPSERDLSVLEALYADGYSTAEIIAGVERAVTAALTRNTIPRRFTYCTPAIRDVPPKHPPSDESPARPVPATERVVTPAVAEPPATSLLTPTGQPVLAVEQAATPAVAEPPVARSRPSAAALNPLHEIAQSLQQSAWERGLDLDQPTVRDLARLAVDFEAAATRQGSSGLVWTLEALRRVDSQVESPARYVRAILENWKQRGCDAPCAVSSPCPELPQPEQESPNPLPVQPTTCLELSEAIAGLWKEALGHLQLEMTQATFNTWLRNTRLLELRRGDEGTVWIVEAPSRYAQEWLQYRLLPTIQRTLARLIPGTVQVQFVIPDERR